MRNAREIDDGGEAAPSAYCKSGSFKKDRQKVEHRPRNNTGKAIWLCGKRPV